MFVILGSCFGLGDRMGDDERLLRFQYSGGEIDIMVDVDMVGLLDLVIDYEDRAKKEGLDQPRFPTFAYVWKMKHQDLLTDKDLMLMFERLPKKEVIHILVGSGRKMSALNETVMSLRQTQAQVAKDKGKATMCSVAGVDGDLGSDDVSVVNENTLSVKEKHLPEVTIGGSSHVGDRPKKLEVRRSLRLSSQPVDGGVVEDRVEAHMKSIKGVELEEHETDNEEVQPNYINDYDPATEYTWAEVTDGMDLENPKSLKKFLKEMEKKEKELKKQKSAATKLKGKKVQSDNQQPSSKTKKPSQPKAKSQVQKQTKVTLPNNKPPPANKDPEATTNSPVRAVIDPISPRRSPRFASKSPASKLQLQSTTNTASDTHSQNPASTKKAIDDAMYTKKLPKTTALRKGLWKSAEQLALESASETQGDVENENTADGTDTQSHTTEDEDYEAGSDSSDSDSGPGGLVSESDLHPEERGNSMTLARVEDNWQPHMWADFMDCDADDEDYYGRLYRNGELYEEKEFGKIVLKPWMIFTEKSHFKDTLKDYCVQEGFAINILWADSTRYTAICSSQCCDWRIHASRLADGRTWAIKKIDPNFHRCRGLETNNPICNVKWAAKKLMEDIRSNPEISGNELNGILYKRYGLLMKTSTIYKMKKHVITELFGGHDESYGFLPSYVKMIHATNPGSKAFCSWTDIGDPQRSMQFSSIYISFTAQMEGLLAGCRSLIGVDGTHLKGNYGGILLSAIGLDGNNEIFPIAYAIVSIENEDNWSFFFWHLYNQVKNSGRDNWTIISDRQKVEPSILILISL